MSSAELRGREVLLILILCRKECKQGSVSALLEAGFLQSYKLTPYFLMNT